MSKPRGAEVWPNGFGLMTATCAHCGKVYRYGRADVHRYYRYWWCVVPECRKRNDALGTELPPDGKAPLLLEDEWLEKEGRTP